jgi:vacuolar-type H+-ATPase subunit B/Vma2
MAKAAKRSRKQQFVEEMVAEQRRTAEMLQSLSTVVGESRLSSGDRLLEEIRRLLDDVLVAQHRTNHLLELALRAGFDDEEQARTT